MPAWKACLGPTRCTSVALSYKGSEGDLKLGPVANNGKTYSQWEAKFGDAASEFSTLRDATDPLSMSALEACLLPSRCTPVAFGFKGLEWGSTLGPVANNSENIASGRQSLGMRPRNLRPCGRQRALSACRPWRPVWGLLGVPPLL